MTPPLEKLGLGTVQFGMGYGVTNTSGIPSSREISDILKTAHDAGLRTLDTAPVYGTSEESLGACLPPQNEFRIVTKISPARAEDVAASLTTSLQKLRQRSVYGLLIHNADHLLGEEGKPLVEAMRALQEKGLVQKIGVSIYAREQAEKILDRFQLDVIQLPISILDQRLLADRFLLGLRKRGIEIHARSIFLQGILLQDPERLPSFFSPLHASLKRFFSFIKEQRLTPLQAALHFALGRPELNTVLVGVGSLNELRQILDAARRLPDRSIDWSPFACKEKDMLDPSKWPALGPAA